MSDSEPSGSGGLDLDLSGQQLGDYRLLRRLGRGGMADVYLAEQSSLRRQVAFKVLKRELAKDDVYVRRFHNEAQAAAALVDAHIVQIYEVGCVAGVHYIAQEYVAGQNLRELLTRRGPTDVKLVVSVLRQVTAALAKAADQGIIHRDIKPENILLTKAGEVKVADFGLARIGGNGDSMSLTQTGMTMGTPLYMSPEQVEGRTLDPRSDIYSLGVTCYHMLTGQPPFRGETALSVAVQHVKNQPDRLENRRPDLPTGLCRIVHKMLAKKPDDRYPNARELLRELRALGVEGPEVDWSFDTDPMQLLDTPAQRAAPSGATRRLASVMKTQALAAQRRRGWWRWVSLTAVGAFVLGGLGAMLSRGPFLLDVPAAETAVERKASARDQYLYAYDLASEAGWKSVAEYFPADKKYVPYAEEQLAMFYVQKDQFDAALALFQKLAHADEVEVQRRAFGLAGECVVYSILPGKEKESAEKADELYKHAPKQGPAGDSMPARLERVLHDPQMVGLVEDAIKRVHQSLYKQNATEWEEWRKTHFPDEAAPGS